MKVLKEKKVLECSASTLWSILSDVTRCDWVPTINKIELEGDCRVFEMEGMGQIKEENGFTLFKIKNNKVLAEIISCGGHDPENKENGAIVSKNIVYI